MFVCEWWAAKLCRVVAHASQITLLRLPINLGWQSSSLNTKVCDLFLLHDFFYLLPSKWTCSFILVTFSTTATGNSVKSIAITWVALQIKEKTSNTIKQIFIFHFSWKLLASYLVWCILVIHWLWCFRSGWSREQ